MNGERVEHENVCVCVCACMHVCVSHCTATCLHMFSCVYNVCFCSFFRSYANNIKDSCTAGITKRLRGREAGGV